MRVQLSTSAVYRHLVSGILVDVFLIQTEVTSYSTRIANDSVRITAVETLNEELGSLKHIALSAKQLDRVRSREDATTEGTTR
jgi:hypothetical protein